VVQEVLSFLGVSLGFESSLVSQPSLVDTMVMPMQSLADTPLPLGVDASLDLVVSHPVQPTVMSMQYSTDTTPIFGSDASLDLVVSHPIQPTIEEVVMPMKYLTDPTILLESDKPKEVTLQMQSLVSPALLLEGDVSFNHVLSISIFVLYSPGRISLSSSMLPQSPRVVSIDWTDLLEPQPPSSTPFQIRGILQYIVDKVTYESILSSSTWKDLGFPKLVSALGKLLTFHRNPAREPWCPPLYVA
jgi:hypothetical protein